MEWRSEYEGTWYSLQPSKMEMQSEIIAVKKQQNLRGIQMDRRTVFDYINKKYRQLFTDNIKYLASA